jgi:hypothetical protein
LARSRFQTLEDYGKLRDPSAAKLVQPVEDPWLEALQDHAIGTFDLLVHSGVCHGHPIHVDMVIIAEIKKLFASELCAVVSNDGIWDPEAMNNVGKEEHHLLGFDLCDWLGLDPLQELVDGNKQVGEAPMRFLERRDKIQTLDRERPSDRDRLERLGW